MKIAKRSLSVLLSILMIFGTCSVCLSGFAVTASAASSYSAADVKAAVTSTATKINSKSSSGNAYAYTGDDGSVLAAADAVYDYAVNSVRGGTSNSSNYNSSDTLSKRVSDLISASSGTANYNAVQRLINATGTTVYGNTSKQTSSSSFENTDSYGNGTDLTNNSWVSYSSNVTNSVSKTASVAVDVNAYLLTVSSVSAIPSSFPTKVTYTYNHTYAQSATQTSQTSRSESSGGCNPTTTWYYTHNWTSYKWNYLSGTSRTVNSTNTTAKTQITSYANYFTADRLATTATTLVNSGSISDLQSTYTTALNTFNTMKSNYSDAVLQHFFGSDYATKIQAYLDNITFAEQVLTAKPNLDILNANVGIGYHKDNLTEMTTLLTTLNNAYNIVKDYDQAIFDYLSENYAAYENFSLAAAKEFIDQVVWDINVYKLGQIKASIAADISANEAKLADPLNATDITDVELAALKDKFVGYQNSIAQYTTAEINSVFTEGLTYISDFQNDINLKIATRNATVAYTPYYTYYLPLIFANIAKWSNSDVTSHYTSDTAKQTQLVNTYNAAISSIGADLAKGVYTFVYEEKPYLLTTAVSDYLARLKTNIIDRNEAQLDAVSAYAGSSNTVNFSNFVGLSATIGNIDEDLYSYNLNKGWITSSYQSLYGRIVPLKTAYEDFVATGGLNQFKQVHYHNSNGIYTIRYAGEQTVNGETVGYSDDLARNGSADNYNVTEANVKSTIEKLDSFITSADLGSLAEFKDKDGNIVADLPTYIDKLLSEQLFTNDMVNTLVGALYPMLCSTISNLLTDLPSMGIEGINAPTDSSAVCSLDLDKLSGGEASGTMNLYLDGQKGTVSLRSVFEGLGLNIYPVSFANSLPSSANGVSYSAMKSAFSSAGTDWTKIVGADGDTKLEYDWGVTDYDSFLTAVGCVFNSILPLLQTALAGANYDKTVTNLAYVSGPVTYSGFALNASASANAQIKLTGMTLYKDLWIPIMEQLGITDSGYDLSALGYSGAYSFKSISTSATAKQIASAMFEPMLVLIEQLKDQPIEKVCEILPQVSYFLSFDGIQNMLKGVSIPLSVHISINKIDDVSFQNGVAGFFLDWVLSAAKGIIADKIAFDVSPELNLGNMVNISDLLGVDIRNINAIIQFVFEKLELNLSLPVINVGEVIQCSSVNTNASSASTSGKRTKFTADKADVFYFLLNYVVSAIGDRQFVESIIQFIQDKNADPDADPSVPVEAAEVPEFLYSIIDQVHSDPKAALAALVELFNPKQYDTWDYDWYTSDEYYQVEDFSQSSVIYLNYGNNWTKTKADYMVENAEKVFDSLVKDSTTGITSLSQMLTKTVSDIFSNEGLSGLIKLLVTLGATISGNETVSSLIERETGVDLTAWFDAFGYYFPEVAEEAGVEAPTAPGSLKDENGNIIPITLTPTTKVDEKTGEEVTTFIISYNGAEFTDGDREQFVNIFCGLCDEMAPLVSLIFSGEDMTLFNNAITLLGYEGYENSVGMMFKVLGMTDVMSQSEYNAYCSANGSVAAFNYLTQQLFDWIDGFLSGNVVKNMLELLPRVCYFIESNGLAVSMHNLLMPVLIVLDDVRPIVDLDVNNIVSVILTDFLADTNFTLDADILDILFGTSEEPLEAKYSFDIANLRLTDVVTLIDQFFGTNFKDSQLVTRGLEALCAGKTAFNNNVQEGFTSVVSASDTLTIIISSLLEALEAPSADETKSNAAVICEFIDTVSEGSIDASGIYASVRQIFEDVEVDYDQINWAYMYGTDFDYNTLSQMKLPEQSIVYLNYANNWKKTDADTMADLLGNLVDSIVKGANGGTVSDLINGILNDNVYTDDIFNTVVEAVVKALCSLDVSLRDLIDCAIDTNIAEWFSYCTIDTDEEGNVTVTCNKDWGVTDKASFIAAFQEALRPAYSIISWLFFGQDYKFFTGSETDANGHYTYNDIITIKGGEGYAYGLVPVLEALGCTMNCEFTDSGIKPADLYATDSGFDVETAIGDVLGALLGKVDEVTAKPVDEVMELLPNLIYFINAGGMKVSVNNLLSPVYALLDKLSPVISSDGLELNIDALIGFPISNITWDSIFALVENIEINEDGDKIVIPEDMKEFISSFYMGKVTYFTSANGQGAMKMGYSEDHGKGDMLTIVLSLAAELISSEENSKVFKKLIGDEAIFDLFNGYELDSESINWAYMYKDFDYSKLAEMQLPEQSIVYLSYSNNWNNQTAEYLSDKVSSLVDTILEATKGTDLSTLLTAVISDNVYNDKILNTIVEALVKALYSLDESLRDAIDCALDTNIKQWFSYCDITEDEEGNVTVTCNKEWGVTDKATFTKALNEAISPAYSLLGWLCFGQDYNFFTSSEKDSEGNYTYKDMITIKGGQGYATGLVPVLEALGCTMGYEGTDSGIKPASAYYDKEANTYDVATAVNDVVTALLDKVDDISSSPVDKVFDILPNLVYFINADGVKASVNNLLAPVNSLLKMLSPIVGEDINLDALLGFPLSDITFDSIFGILEDKLGITVPAACQNFITSFFMGKVTYFTSANGEGAMTMSYNDKYTKKDMLTIILSLAVDIIGADENKETFSGLFGADIYNTIANILNIKESKPMQDFAWYYTEYANTDKSFSAIDTSGKYTGTYNDKWTREMAGYISDNFEAFLNDFLQLMGIEVNGADYKDISAVVTNLVETNLYTQSLADKLLGGVQKLMNAIKGNDYGEYIAGVLKNATGLDVYYWDNLTVTVEDGNRESFTNALCEILVPALPLFNILLNNQDVSLLVNINGQNTITIPGSEGYAYGVIPVLEALKCENIKTPAEYKAAIAADPTALVTSLVNPVFDRIEAIEADPATEVVSMLPGIIYFINSNGLDTCVKNIFNTLDTVLEALEPALGETNAEKLFGISDLDTYDFDYIFGLLLKLVSDKTGYDLTPIAGDAIAELTVGKVVTYQSKNGETYYTMEYASEMSKEDMATVLLRIAVDFATTDDNVTKLEGILKEYIKDEENYNYVCSTLESLAKSVKEDPSMGNALYIIYYIFYGIQNASSAANGWLKDFDNQWEFVFYLLDNSKEPLLNNFSTTVKNILNYYLDDIIDDGGLAPNGLIKFFQNFVALIQKIFAFFAGLFK